MHFSINNHCEPAAFLANFGISDPGTQTIWNSFIRIPTNVLNAATGISEEDINELKQMPLVTPPGIDSDASIAKLRAQAVYCGYCSPKHVLVKCEPEHSADQTIVHCLL